MTYSTVSDLVEENKPALEVFQTSYFSAVTSVIYSEFIRLFCRREFPSRQIEIPAMKNVEKFLDPDSEFTINLHDHFIDDIRSIINDNEFYNRFVDIDEFKIITNELTKTFFEIHIINNIRQYLPNIIRQKFQIGNPRQQTFIENRDLELFGGQPPADEFYSYIAHETLLNIMMQSLNLTRTSVLADANDIINLEQSQTLSISNKMDLAQIHLNDNILLMHTLMKLLTFVADIEVDALNDGSRQIKSSVFNDILITTFETKKAS